MAKTTSKAATAKANDVKNSDPANASANNDQQNNSSENNELSNNSENNDQQNNPENNEQNNNSEGNEQDNNDAEQSVEAEPSVNVALLPVKLKGQRLTLAYPFDLQKGANNLIIGSKSYAVEDIKFNPYTHRQEIELASVTLLDDSELDALTASGWYVQG